MTDPLPPDVLATARKSKVSAKALAEHIAELAISDRRALIQRVQELIIEDRKQVRERCARQLEAIDADMAGKLWARTFAAAIRSAGT